ncbi:MAG: sulfotransferase [Caulobacteraceae bacterium]
MTPPPAPFIVGVSRSGTTLLRMMLDAHPQLAIPFETHFLNRLVLAGDGLSPAQFLDLVVGTPSWPNLALDADEVARALGEITPFSATEGVRTVYRLCAARAGKARWGDKTPSYLAIMPAIQRLLPEARFVHIVRDGRDTALSFKGLWFGPGDDVKAAARFWNERVRKARAQSAELGHYMEVRYEDLVLDPRAVLTRIGDQPRPGTSTPPCSTTSAPPPNAWPRSSARSVRTGPRAWTSTASRRSTPMRSGRRTRRGSAAGAPRCPRRTSGPSRRSRANSWPISDTRRGFRQAVGGRGAGVVGRACRRPPPSS